jgi:hypothetical protein
MDIQPIANMRILRYVGSEKSDEWGKHFITEGFKGKAPRDGGNQL